MKPADRYKLEALQSFISDDYVGRNIEVLRDLERFLSMQLMNEELDPDNYDRYIWLLHRLETLFTKVEIVENLTQSFRDRNN